MRVEFLDSAEAELVDAVAYYNNESEGLGFEFAAEVNRTIVRILAFIRPRGLRCRSAHAAAARTGSLTGFSIRFEGI